MSDLTPSSGQQSFQAPKGTRDFYPQDLLRRRHVEAAWRSASVRHAFDEIEGPTFEHLDLYTVKSGEGIVSELFSFQRAGGEKDFALRPEFTPTLARMYAARAGALPKPTRWFSIGPYFRAERPQRGRLREFLQWNVDLLGDPSPAADADVLACCADALRSLGLGPSDVKFRISHRRAVELMLQTRGVPTVQLPKWFVLLDKAGKISNDDFLEQAGLLGMKPDVALDTLRIMAMTTPFENPTTQAMLNREVGGSGPHYFQALWDALAAAGIADWCVVNLGIVRGLAYYTGMVFEVHEAQGRERAIAGGGRYDSLVQLFGGPPTPAVGFGLGDAVLSLVLADKNLIPDDRALADRLGVRPFAFVLSNGSDDAEAQLAPAVAQLRRAGLHARRSGKATKNIGKLLKEASDSNARFAVIIESPDHATVKALDTGEQYQQVSLAQLPAFLQETFPTNSA